MERTEIRPHLAWTGPAPEDERDAYLLAMILHAWEEIPGDLPLPITLKPAHIPAVGVLWAFYRDRALPEGPRTTESLLKAIQSLADEDIAAWERENPAAVAEARAALVDFVETEKSPGFRCVG